MEKTRELPEKSEEMVTISRAEYEALQVRKLTAQQYRWLMEGLQIDQPKAHKTMAGMSMV